jgi:hypothetical protein
MSIRKICVRRIMASSRELEEMLYPAQGGYDIETGHWVIRLEDGTIKRYVPDEDMVRCNKNLFILVNDE